MDIILFGMQGSGKGTQAKRIAEALSLEIFEAGAALRKLSQEDSELAQKVKSIMEAGNLVPTEVVMEIIQDFISKLPEGKSVLFDGIPRSNDQKEQLDEIMNSSGRNFTGILIDITEQEALRRLTTRKICTGCKAVYASFYDKEKCEACDGELGTRKDDTPDAIRVRLDTFQAKTLPVIQDYEKEGKMIKVNGEQSIQEVNDAIMIVLKDNM
ncbi:adenylate kinase [Candidatus Peregrinibacteria bacterium]|jgi:adenylate kinase|nr:adenylate kinase [Candidatus Peregrinibacteria bacterium]MBT4631641.1 adenylate kinase [Candidatus Peregrinibacteria bacterium]MBT5516769.1 adenylate kinase [Candidatus Peregrinibacteria bacterium]MBT5823949.1 adenylate kinase [Candidatus Peregrinibacteria bacterium]